RLFALMETNMQRMLQRLGASTADTQFKRAPQGWIFRAPTPWVLGPRPHYLVSEALKAKIEVVLGASHLVVWLFLIPIGFVLILSVGSVPPKVPSVASGLLLIFLYCSLLLPGLQNLWHCLALRALLKNSSRTTE